MLDDDGVLCHYVNHITSSSSFAMAVHNDWLVGWLVCCWLIFKQVHLLLKDILYKRQAIVKAKTFTELLVFAKAPIAQFEIFYQVTVCI